MPNQSGSTYGLTILSPIKDDPHAEISPSLAIRMHLQTLPVDGSGPFGRVSSTHMARLVVLDDVVFRYAVLRRTSEVEVPDLRIKFRR
jgi:hypothetical protein